MKTPYKARDPREWQDFANVIKQAVQEERLDTFCALFLTADERESLGLRLQIVRELLQNKASQREIQQILNTSAATITRGSNMLKVMPADFVNWINEQLNGTQKETK